MTSSFEFPRTTPESQGVSSAAILAFVDAAERIGRRGWRRALAQGEVVEDFVRTIGALLEAHRVDHDELDVGGLGDVGNEGDTYRVVSPVQLDFDIHKDKEKFRLVGTVRADLELSCSRCLEPFRLPVDAAFDLQYLPAAEMAAQHEKEVADEDLDTSYYLDDQIDLNELMREQFYLALPMKPLCGDDCKGLCPQCGTNRNTGSCDCETGWEDPRLAALRQLKRES